MGMLLILIFIFCIAVPISFACTFFRQLDHHFGGGFNIFLNIIIKLSMMLSMGTKKIHILKK